MSLIDKLFSISDKYFDILFRGDSDADLSEKVIERKERLIQTYIIVFGLLIAYDGDIVLQKILMSLFIIFLLVSIAYYTFLSNPYASTYRNILNILAVFIAVSFSLSLIICMYKFTISSSTFYSWILPSQLFSMQFVESFISFSSIFEPYLLLMGSLTWGFVLVIEVVFSLRV